MLRRARWLPALAAAFSLVCVGCEDQGPHGPATVDIMTEDFEFTAPDSVSSGWTTFRMHNQGSEDHLFTLVRLPEDVTYTEYRTEVISPIDSVWSMLLDGTIDLSEVGEKLAPLMPGWFPSEVVQPGGVSLVSSGGSAQTTVKLEPGEHALLCYVLTPRRQFHASRGMVAPLTVFEAASRRLPPDADQTLTVSNLQLEGVGPTTTGRKTFAVRFARDPEGAGAGEGHQHLHLARLDEDTTVPELLRWMEEWIGENPVMPGPVEFLGGAQHMPEGNTAYVTAVLDAGRYAWVLGVPPQHGEIEPFSVE